MRTVNLLLSVAAMLAVSATTAHAAPNATVPEPKKLPSKIAPTVASPSQLPMVDGKPLQSILNSKDYVERLVRYLIGYETWIYICTDAQPEERVRTLVVSEPVDLPGAENNEAPQWLEVVKIRGCDRSYERMIFATFHKGKPVFHAQIAGTSKTSPVVQHEAVTALRASASTAAVADGCDRANRARVISAELDDTWTDASDTKWREIWVVQSCKGTKKVPLVFNSNDSGEVTFRFKLP